MKIVYTIHQFFPKHYTGTERYLLNLATMMKKFGHEVKIFCYDPLPSSQQNFHDGISTSNYSYQNLDVTSIKINPENEYTSTEINNNLIFDYFNDIFRKEKFDILHITHPMRMGSVFWAAKKQKIRTILTLTDYWMMCPKGIMLKNDDSICLGPDCGKNCKKYCYPHWDQKLLNQRVNDTKKIFKNTDEIIASANFLVDLFKFNQYDVSRVNLIRHGYNYFDQYNPADNKNRSKYFTFISTGSMIPSKGSHILISAFKKLTYKNIRLKIYGSSYGNVKYFDYLKKLKGKDNRISFMGIYTLSEVSKIHQKADVLIQPSLLYETYPLVGVAALAYGIPIIVPDKTGAAELVNEGENGYIFKFADIDSLAKQMAIAYKNKLKNNKSIIYQQTVESEAVSTEALYYKVLRK